MLDSKRALGAVNSAIRALDAAAAVDVPWLRGAGPKLTEVQTHLDTAASAFERAVARTSSDARDAATLLGEALTQTRAAQSVAQGRLGVRSLGERVESIRRLAASAKTEVVAADRRQAVGQMRRLLGASYDEMTPASWRALADIAARPAATRPGGLALTGGASMQQHLRQVADIVERGGSPRRDWTGWRTLNYLRAIARFPTQEAATTHLRSILAKPIRELSRQDFHDIDGMLQLTPARRPVALHDVTVTSFASAAQLRASGKHVDRTWSGLTALEQVKLKLEVPDRLAATRRVNAALKGSYDEMTPDDWRDLARIATRPTSVRPPGFMHASGNSLEAHLLDVADRLEQGLHVNPKWGGWRVLNRRRAIAQYPDQAAATRRLHEIARTPRAELTRRDLHDLDGILQLPSERVPRELRGISIETFAESAELRGRGREIVKGWTGWSALNKVRARVLWPDRTSSTAAMRRQLGESYDAMTPNAWRQLAHIADLPTASRPANLEHVTGESMVAHLRQIARYVEDGVQPNTKWSGWSVLNRLRAEARFATAEAAELRLREIATTSRAKLTRQDLHDLDGLRQLPDAIRPAALRDVMTTSIAEAAQLRAAARRINPKWGGWSVHDAAAIEYRLPTDDAARADWVRTQLLARTRGERVDPVFGTLLRLRPELIPADMLETARLQIANELLRDIAEVGVMSETASKPALEAARRALAGWVPKDPAHRPIAEQTLALIDRNLERMRHYAREGEGYLNHPDYAEVGRVRSNIDLLEQLDTLHLDPTPPAMTAPVDEVVETASPTGAATSGTVEDVLTW